MKNIGLIFEQEVNETVSITLWDYWESTSLGTIYCDCEDIVDTLQEIKEQYSDCNLIIDALYNLTAIVDNME